MPRVKGNSPGKPREVSGSQLERFSSVYRHSSGRPERVVNLSLRSVAADFVFVSDMGAGKSKMEIRKSKFASNPSQLALQSSRANPGLYKISKSDLQLSGPAERSYR